MKRELFRCDYCQIQKFNSENQEYINLPFVCDTLAQWKQHITRPKHCMNIARNNNLEDDLVIKCKHCDGVYTNEQYKDHKSHNILLWISNNSIYKESSCNNFVYNNKRFEDLNVLRAYAESRYDTGRKKYEYKPKPKKITSFADRSATMKHLLDEKKTKEQEKKIEKKNKIQKKVVKNTITIEDEFNKLNGIEEKKSNKNDISVEPVWDDDELCSDCNKYTNEYKEYSNEKIKKWNIDLCICGDDSEDEIIYEKEKIIDTTNCCEIKKDSIEMTIEEIDHTERPEFYDYCLDCGCGMKETDVSSKIYDNWDMDYCECESDYEE